MNGNPNKGVGGPSETELDQIFQQFSRPMLRPCITSHQKQNAVNLAKILWLRLVTGTDTEKNVYEDLKLVFKDNHDSNVAVGSMYFFKMKTELTEKQILELKNHYSNENNFACLEQWEPSVLEESR